MEYLKKSQIIGIYFLRKGEPLKDDNDQKSFDPALFDVTRIPVDDFANQITLDDFDYFKRITPEEVSCTKEYSTWTVLS